MINGSHTRPTFRQRADVLVIFEDWPVDQLVLRRWPEHVDRHLLDLFTDFDAHRGHGLELPRPSTPHQGWQICHDPVSSASIKHKPLQYKALRLTG
jgi:hypothetical protein